MLAMLIFTDGSSNGKIAYVVDSKVCVEQTDLVSAQIVELRAVALVFQLFAGNALNLHTDSHYIFRVLQVIETVPCIETSNSQDRIPFQKIQNAIHQRMVCHALWIILGHIPRP